MTTHKIADLEKLTPAELRELSLNENRREPLFDVKPKPFNIMDLIFKED